MRRGSANSAQLTEWMLSEEEVLDRAERALAELEWEMVEKSIRNGYPELSGHPSPTVEEVARRAGVNPVRLLKLVKKHGPALDFMRVRCTTRSKLGWCLRHRDIERGLIKFYRGKMETLNELWRIRMRILRCTSKAIAFSHVIPCDIASAEELLGLLAKAQALAEVLGIPEDRIDRFKEWLGVSGTVTTADGTVVIRNGEAVHDG